MSSPVYNGYCRYSKVRLPLSAAVPVLFLLSAAAAMRGTHMQPLSPPTTPRPADDQIIASIQQN